MRYLNLQEEVIDQRFLPLSLCGMASLGLEIFTTQNDVYVGTFGFESFLMLMPSRYENNLKRKRTHHHKHRDHGREDRRRDDNKHGDRSREHK